MSEPPVRPKPPELGQYGLSEERLLEVHTRNKEETKICLLATLLPTG